VLVQDTAVYDSQGLLHADIDTLSGGFNSGHLDPIGYKGELGNYTDLETQRQVSGLYTALSGPGGAGYYDPLTGVGMARDAADSANEYSDNLNSVEPALHSAFVGVTGLLPGPGGALGAGLIDGEITYIETGNIKTALVRGGTTAGFGLAFGKAGSLIGGPFSRYMAGRLSEEAAPTVAGAISKEATSGGIAIATEGTAQAGSGASSPLLDSIRAAGGTLAVPNRSIRATDLADLTKDTGNEFVLYRDRATKQLFIKELGRVNGQFPHGARLIIHSQPGEGLVSLRPSPEDFAALKSAKQHSSLIIDAGKTGVLRYTRSSEETKAYGVSPLP